MHPFFLLQDALPAEHHGRIEVRLAAETQHVRRIGDLLKLFQEKGNAYQKISRSNYIYGQNLTRIPVISSMRRRVPCLPELNICTALGHSLLLPQIRHTFINISRYVSFSKQIK